MSIKIFVSYAVKDEKLWEALQAPLSPLVDTKTIQLWSAHKDIVPGQNRMQEINKNLQTTQLFLLLLSVDYIANTECMQQAKEAVARMQHDGPQHVHVIPIMLRPFVLQMLRGTGLEGLEALPRQKPPISSWPSRDDAIMHVTGELYEIIDNIDKNEFNSGSTPASSNPTPQPPANHYNLASKTINAGIIGDNHGMMINNNGAGTVGKTRTTQAPADQQNEVTDVGIIIALIEEFRVLFADIQKIHKRVYDAETDEYYYTFEHKSEVKGRPYRCVTTFIGGEGPIKAALQTQKMIMRWNPSTLVLPGIAASLSSDVKIGDVVIADQIDAYQENARANPILGQPGYTLAFSGETYKSSSVLSKAIQNFEFNSPDILQAWQTDCETALLQLALLQRKQLTDEKILSEQARFIKGHIASGSIVGAAQGFTNWLKTRDRKYLALEMEAAGLMTAVYEQAVTRDTLVLRAISDFGDENKSDLDDIGDGLLRKYAMRNAVQLLWSFLDAGLLQQKA